MEERELSFDDVPRGYQLCFNSACSLCEQCMHYHVGQLVPDHWLGGPAVYPSAWAGGTCVKFRQKGLVQMAWGFSKLYKHVPSHQVSLARNEVYDYLGGYTAAYYRYHHGERLLSPVQQQAILDILARYGSTEGLRFDHYSTSYDFTQ